MANTDAWWMRATGKSTEWMVDGLCRQVDPDLFFPESGANITNAARKVCEACPVQEECLDYALDHPGITGMWGGMTEGQRALMRRRQQKVSA